MPRTPDFILIGAMKCGTTSLKQNLNTHDEIHVVPEEPRFFHSDRYDEQGLEQYFSLFEGRAEAVVGESSGFYAWDSWCEDTAERMGRDVPEAKILYIIRHPVERVESHWAWGIGNGQSWGTINEAVQEVDRLIEMSLHWRQLSRYRTHFDDDQIKVLFLEDLKADSRAFFRDCGRFLGVNPDGFDFGEAATPKNQTADKRTDTRLAQRLRQWSGFWSLKGILPDSVIRLGKQVLRRDGKMEPDWDEAMRRRVEERLAPDAARMLDYCERSRGLWSFDTLSLKKVDPASDVGAAA
ncbi:sulfotransferase domain-containing protein [Salinibacter altiplanensis]|uniref:sulfotransferase domain-containing protein n=1 Tax=Salinibacter altiplanensis TaxID=1803181 RepID=UPI0013000329|nr:sulfotransferase [Salinibacter altiplanensis]